MLPSLHRKNFLISCGLKQFLSLKLKLIITIWKVSLTSISLSLSSPHFRLVTMFSRIKGVIRILICRVIILTFHFCYISLWFLFPISLHFFIEQTKITVDIFKCANFISFSMVIRII